MQEDVSVLRASQYKDIGPRDGIFGSETFWKLNLRIIRVLGRQIISALFNHLDCANQLMMSINEPRVLHLSQLLI